MLGVPVGCADSEPRESEISSALLSTKLFLGEEKTSVVLAGCIHHQPQKGRYECMDSSDVESSQLMTSVLLDGCGGKLHKWIKGHTAPS